MANLRILVVDDEALVLRTVVRALDSLDATVEFTSDSREGARLIQSQPFDVVIADINMPDLNGIDLLRIAREQDPGIAVMLVTGLPALDTAIEGLRFGAADYVLKPILADDIVMRVRRVLDARRIQQEHRALRRQVGRVASFTEIVGESAAMREIGRRIQLVAGAGVDVLIIGETGTGKELVARAIHAASSRASGPLMPVDCGAIPEHLFESELFGYERGAFTGADSRTLGLLELASGGTFFMDEFLSLPMSVQPKLLRVLEERRLRRVGGKEEIEIDVRLVVAANRDPLAEVAARRLREDLYYRIDVGRIEIPPLRERAEDIPLLVRLFADRFNRETGDSPVSFTAEAMEVLMASGWPGNVRELQNVVKRALVMRQGDEVGVDDLPEEVVAASAHPDTDGSARGLIPERDEHMAEFERRYLSRVLVRYEGDVSACAREAGVPRGTLYRLMRKHGIDPAGFRKS